MNQEIGVLIEILNEKLETIQVFLEDEVVANGGYEKLTSEVHDLDVTFLNYFNRVKATYGSHIFQEPGLFKGEEILSLQKAISETQDAEARLLEKKNRDEFENLKTELNKNRDVAKRIKTYQKIRK